MRTSFATILVLSAVTGFSATAHAGFEFMAPQVAPKTQQMLVPSPVVSPMVAPAPIAAVPAPSVMAAPVAPIMPSAPAAKHGLIINPYPMQGGNRQYNMADISSGSLNRALFEEAQQVTPMPLGPNMRTGAQPEMVRPKSKPAQQMANYAGSTAMVPMPGVSPEPVQRQALPAAMTYQEAVGFGKEIPLSIALMQIVPEGYATQLPGNDLENKIVSWKGGKPWNQVLNDVLRPLGYDASIQGKQVVVAPYLRG